VCGWRVDWVEFPGCVAPTARHGYAHPDGEIATARGICERRVWGETRNNVLYAV